MKPVFARAIGSFLVGAMASLSVTKIFPDINGILQLVIGVIIGVTTLILLAYGWAEEGERYGTR